jgi:hypothetical protein
MMPRQSGRRALSPFLGGGSHLYVYDISGRLIDMIEIPNRPLQEGFGRKDGQTLFIPARRSLCAVRTKYEGR